MTPDKYWSLWREGALASSILFGLSYIPGLNYIFPLSVFLLNIFFFTFLIPELWAVFTKNFHWTLSVFIQNHRFTHDRLIHAYWLGIMSGFVVAFSYLWPGAVQSMTIGTAEHSVTVPTFVGCLIFVGTTGVLLPHFNREF